MGSIIQPTNPYFQQFLQNLPPELQQQVQGSMQSAQNSFKLPLIILSSLMQREYTTEGGRKVKIPRPMTAASSPAQMGDDLIRAADRQLSKQVAAPLMREYEKQRHGMLVELLTREYYDPDDPNRTVEKARERAETHARNPSIEKVLLHGLMWLNGHNEALKTVSQYMDRLSGGNFSAGGEMDRRRHGLMQTAAQLYRNVSDMGPESPLTGENTLDKMKAALSIMGSGGFHGIFAKGGMFDETGQLTDKGRTEVNRLYKNAGQGITELRKLTGTDAMQSLQLSRRLFGANALKQLTDEDTVQSLGSYRHLADMTGLSPKGRIQLLARLRGAGGKDSDILPALNSAKERLSMELLGDWMGPVDPGERSKLLGKVVEGASKSNWIKAASAGAAALSDEYGRSTGWALTQDILQKSPLSPGAILKQTNRLLDPGGRITRDNLKNYIASDESYDFYRSGRALPRAVTREAYRVYRDMSQQSPWVRKHFPRILKQFGSLTRDSITKYLDEHGASSAEQGQVLQHINSFGDRYSQTYGTGDMDAVLNFLSAGARHRDRSQVLKEAVRRGKLSRDLAPAAGSTGIAGILESLSRENPKAGVMGTLGSAAIGPMGELNKETLEAAGVDASRLEQRMNAPALRTRPPWNREPPPAPPEAPKKPPAAPKLDLTPKRAAAPPKPAEGTLR